MAIPSVKGHPWYDYDWPRNVFLGVAAAAGSVAAFHKGGVLDLGWWLLPLVIVTAASLVLGWGYSIVQSVQRDRKKAVADSPQDLLGCLHVLYHLIKERQGIGSTPADRKRLRVTIHKVDGTDLEQCTEYLGGDSSSNGSRGRRTPLQSGIIGLAARTGHVIHGQRTNDDYQAFLDEMIRDWGFDREQARQLTPDRQAWLAVPIAGGAGGVLAVVYLDSNDRAFFADDVRDIVIHACAGICAFIDLRYGH